MTRPISGLLNVGNDARAAHRTMRVIDEAQMTPSQVDDALRAARADGQDMFTAADAIGFPAQRQLAGVATQPGGGRTAAHDLLEARQGSSSDRLAQYVQEHMGATNTRTQQELSDRVSRGAASDVNYAAARANAEPVDVRGVLAAIDERIGPMSNTTIQGDGADAVLDGYRRRLAGVVSEGGEALPGELSDINRLIRLYGEMGGSAGQASRAGNDFLASEIRRVQSSLGEALEVASPDWRAANAQHAAASRVVDATGDGRAANVGSRRFEDVRDEWEGLGLPIERLNGLTDAQRADYMARARDAYRTGYAERDLALLEGARTETRNMAGTLFDNPRQRQNYGMMADDPDRFFRRVDRENEMARTRHLTFGGSRTSANDADQLAVNGADVPMIANLLSGNIPGAASQGLVRGYQAAAGLNEGTRRAIAEALLTSEPGRLGQVIQRAQADDARRVIVEGLLRGATRPVVDQIAR